MPPAERGPVTGPSRTLPRWLLLLAAALLVARIGVAVWENAHPPAVPEATDLVTWVDVSQAEAESRRTHKPILYDFTAEWCAPCKLMANEVFANSVVAERIDRMFVPVRVIDRQQEEGQNSPAVARLERDYRVRGFPTLVIAWPGVEKYETVSGYGGAERTTQWLMSKGVEARMSAPPAAIDSVLNAR
jgi:thiol:disulfide interchange protein